MSESYVPRPKRSTVRQVGGMPPMIGTPITQKYDELRSRWTILINTNTAFKDQRRFENVYRTLRQATMDLTEQDELERAHILEAYRFQPPLANGSLSRATPTELIAGATDPYQGSKVLFAFETGPDTSYLHEHIDMTLDHRYGPGAVALLLNKQAFYNYIMGRLIRDAGWDPAHKLFIRIRRVPAFMGKSYLRKQSENQERIEAEQRRFDIDTLVHSGIPRDTALAMVDGA